MGVPEEGAHVARRRRPRRALSPPPFRDSAAAEVYLASDDLIEIDGVIKEVFPGGAFLVGTDAGTQVHAHLAGKLRRFRIRVVLGDRVTVAVSPYDLSKGRITFRHK